MHNCTYSIQAWDDSLGQWASSVEDQVDFKNWLQPFNKLTSTLQQSSASQMRACCWRTPAIQSATNHDSNILGIHAPPWGRGGGCLPHPVKHPCYPAPPRLAKMVKSAGHLRGKTKVTLWNLCNSGRPWWKNQTRLNNDWPSPIDFWPCPPRPNHWRKKNFKVHLCNRCQAFHPNRNITMTNC